MTVSTLIYSLYFSLADFWCDEKKGGIFRSNIAGLRKTENHSLPATSVSIKSTLLLQLIDHPIRHVCVVEHVVAVVWVQSLLSIEYYCKGIRHDTARPGPDSEYLKVIRRGVSDAKSTQLARVPASYTMFFYLIFPYHMVLLVPDLLGKMKSVITSMTDASWSCLKTLLSGHQFHHP